MAQHDRWTLKVLSLPVFHASFSRAVLASPLADPAFVIALDADSATDVQIKIHELRDALDESVAERLLTDLSQLEQFWSLIVAAEKGFFQSTALQLGFGLCEHRDLPSEGSLIDKLKKEAAIRSLVRSFPCIRVAKNIWVAKSWVAKSLPDSDDDSDDDESADSLTV